MSLKIKWLLIQWMGTSAQKDLHRFILEDHPLQLPWGELIARYDFFLHEAISGRIFIRARGQIFSNLPIFWTMSLFTLVSPTSEHVYMAFTG